MTNIHQLDKEIFDFLYNYHLSEKAARREFYFDIRAILIPKWGEKDEFYWLDYLGMNSLRFSFWDKNDDYRAHLEIKKEDYYNVKGYLSASCSIDTPDKPINEAFKNVVKALCNEPEWVKVSSNWGSWGSTEHLSCQKYYDNIDITTFLTNFLKNDKKIIDELFLVEKEDAEKLLFPIPKTTFETNLFRGHFLTSSPKEETSNLPTRLVKLWVKNFKGIKAAKIENIPANTQWIFLTGENGIGKTVLLQAIAYGLFGFSEVTDGEKNRFNQENTDILIVKCIKDKYEYIYFNTFGQRTIPINIAMFGASRLENTTNGKVQDKTAHLFEKSTQLRNIDNFLFQIAINTLRQNQYELLKNILCNILNLKDIDIDRKENRTLYFEQESDKPVFFSQLSAGYKNLINLIGNIIVELSTSHLDIQAAQDLTGIVIIDEIEAHLHPKMQRFLVEKLTELFPKVQFIVSTHSPIPLLSAPKESVIFHVDRTKEAGITVERLPEAVGKSIDYMMANVFETPEKYEAKRKVT